MASHIEDREQISLVSWSKMVLIPDSILGGKHRVYDYLCAIPNGGKRNAIEAARLVKGGVKSGMPDLFLFIPNNGYSGLFIEMKRPALHGKPKGRVSLLQKEVMQRLSDAGYKCEVAYGFNEGANIICDYLGITRKWLN